MTSKIGPATPASGDLWIEDHVRRQGRIGRVGLHRLVLGRFGHRTVGRDVTGRRPEKRVPRSRRSPPEPRRAFRATCPCPGSSESRRHGCRHRSQGRSKITGSSIAPQLNSSPCALRSVIVGHFPHAVDHHRRLAAGEQRDRRRIVGVGRLQPRRSSSRRAPSAFSSFSALSPARNSPSVINSPSCWPHERIDGAEHEVAARRHAAQRETARRSPSGPEAWR
jgi:hypothetical protein